MVAPPDRSVWFFYHPRQSHSLLDRLYLFSQCHVLRLSSLIPTDSGSFMPRLYTKPSTILLFDEEPHTFWHILALKMLRAGLNHQSIPNSPVADAAHGHHCSAQPASVGPGSLYDFTACVDFEPGHNTAFLHLWMNVSLQGYFFHFQLFILRRAWSYHEELWDWLSGKHFTKHRQLFFHFVALSFVNPKEVLLDYKAIINSEEYQANINVLWDFSN